jgi:hypothetical protein
MVVMGNLNEKLEIILNNLLQRPMWGDSHVGLVGYFMFLFL